MTLIQHDAITGGGGNSLLDTLRGYFVRYRLALYLLSGAAVALGVALNWSWLTAAGLFRIVAVLPCASMMFRCMRRGPRRSAEETAVPDKTYPFRFLDAVRSVTIAAGFEPFGNVLLIPKPAK